MNATNPPQTQRTTLYYREGSSDKVYQASVEPQAEGFIVNFAYGRRGSTMNTGTKTQTPVDYETAKGIVRELNTVIDTVKLAEKERKSSEKEIEAIRSKLRQIQSVAI